VWHGDGDRLEYDLEVAPGVDAKRVELEVGGSEGLAIGRDGSLEIATRAGTLVQQPPRVVQSGRELSARYVLTSPTRVGFSIEGYDPSAAVLIDPVFVSYSTYLGDVTNDFGFAIAVDAAGSAYITGRTPGLAFPTKSPLQPANAGGDDAFVAKLTPAGDALVYATYLGGSGPSGDVGTAIAVDASGNAYVAGSTSSTNFPTKNALQSANGGSGDAFIAKLSSSGAQLVYSTYLGGSWGDSAAGLVVDASGSAYVAGGTTSGDFPLQSPFEPVNGAGNASAFVAKLSPSGTSLVYSTYLGGSSDDFAQGIAIDASHSAYVVGATSSSDFPTKGAIQPMFGGGQYDGFVTKLAPTGTSLVYSTYLGGSGPNIGDAASAVVTDAQGNAYVTGFTNSINFPTKLALQPAFAGGPNDAFVTKLNPAGSAFVYSTFLGGSGDDDGQAIAVDANGVAYVTGPTESNDFPTHQAFQAASGGNRDIFVSALAADGLAFAYSTYLGGGSNDQYYVTPFGRSGIALDASKNAYVVGETFSIDFPLKNPLQPLLAGGSDAFITKLSNPDLASGIGCTLDAECSSDHCVDGVCCDTACADPCGACDVTGHVSVCSAVQGAPHGSRAACPGTGVCGTTTCDGAHTLSCSLPDVSTLCSSACTDGVETDSHCDGQGSCVVGSAHSCNGLLCADASTCKIECVTNTDCAAGFSCGPDHACKPGSVCVDDHTSKAVDETVSACSPYACSSTGDCNTSCKSVDDCLAPNVCDPSSHCIAPPSSAAGCSCHTAADQGGAPVLVLLVLAIAVSRGRPASARRSA
jgi:hypothetical protein